MVHRLATHASKRAHVDARTPSSIARTPRGLVACAITAAGLVEQRERRGRSMARSRLDWLAVPGFAIEPDSVVARRIGCPASSVRDARRRMGLDSPRGRIDWAGVDWTHNDREIAGRIGASVSAVMRRRLALGILRDGPTDCRRSQAWDNDSLLGVVPDSIVAHVRGRAQGSVASARRRRCERAATFTVTLVPITDAMLGALRRKHPRTPLAVAAWLELARSLGVHDDATG
jgi:hypothetical protein